MTTEPQAPIEARDTATGESPLLEVSNLYVEYLTPRGPALAVHDVSFSIARGQVFGLAGESGCGKSTIAHTLLRVLRPPAVIRGGQIVFEGRRRPEDE